ncbi:HU family DNA-binding protein [Mesoplasma lactucae]|uniref:DNA-binding protein n=1 Tax=Mesoplasma lactucae ATCC 49193 TaxID=81460 RepID=A0A291IRH2_9MOLU|nr:HU family DNA-binding protein [Mesoplasma lactucae]ATG97291.1 DNA-binding protein [Mesoplasma lactucae ATCC 49193]ATZ20259.1 DNA-binding protein HU-beta [Mesoplasma lactucae ATCC 49193]MCL8216430.1 DNA-binding protein HU-beta [Mesoplasma lactucae ATCC 49193]
MTKKELAVKVAEANDLSQAAADKIITSVFATISTSLVKGDEIMIPGFGKFSISHRAARTGLNPRTKEKLTIPASKSVKFKAGKQLKESVNK